MGIDERLEIETPEGALLVLSPAGPLPRAMAYSIDLCLRLLIFALASIALALLGKGGTGILLILAFMLEWFYPTLFEAFRHGQTPGKKAMGLTVVHANGSPLSVNGSLIRNLLRTADALPLFYLVGFVSTLFSPRSQRLGDMAANTLVVHTLTSPTAHAATSGPASAPDWPVSHQDQLALLAFQERQHSFSTERQEELATLLYPELAGRQALQQLQAVSGYLLQGQQAPAATTPAHTDNKPGLP